MCAGNDFGQLAGQASQVNGAFVILQSGWHARAPSTLERRMRKADWTITDKNGLTPLALALEKKRTAIVQLLRKHGTTE